MEMCFNLVLYLIFADEKKSNMAVHLLPLLFPPGMKRKEGRKGPSKHATTEDARTSFIQVEKVGLLYKFNFS